ncbi:MAG: DUF3034 family protein [Gammaproteobacteria bacterium]|nr:DUF3034 family protein [Gammaproteobacteria bacterium]MBU2056996.1 DUF3034 family protein [Gammaproteobacteria bacterium]MBU2174472.1 DUF3034 family protein [Gammaproteobacteria bacterium]MBU2248164.1 DUF3034 family protein [Gammaproteobacteria bacterium]MBU2346446.1 DUF3034 family protein [Gammaproteobacteria bacterium]
MKTILTALCLLVASGSLMAGSKVIATGGATNIEGNSGGGIVPWATINGYSSSDEWSVNAFAARVGVDDFTLDSYGVGASFNNQWELSFARQKLELDTIGGELRQDILGIKYKVAGELLYTAMPQISLGLQLKKNRDFALPAAVGAGDDSGYEFYIAATKVFFDAVAGRNLLLNATVRSTDAHQTGLLGFGGQGLGRKLMFESSAVLLLNYNLAVGTEFKQKPNQLDFADEQHWRDLFAAWFINKNASVVLGYVDLGDIAGLTEQTGFYLSVEGTW